MTHGITDSTLGNWVHALSRYALGQHECAPQSDRYIGAAWTHSQKDTVERRQLIVIDLDDEQKHSHPFVVYEA